VLLDRQKYNAGCIHMDISKLGRYIMEVMEVMGNNVVIKFGSNGSN
jgi:hypothetical protein